MSNTLTPYPAIDDRADQFDAQLCCARCGELNFTWSEAERATPVQIREQHGLLVVQEQDEHDDLPYYLLADSTLACAACGARQPKLLQLLVGRRVLYLNVAGTPLRITDPEQQR